MRCDPAPKNGTGSPSTLDRVAGGKTIARKKRLGPAGISTGGHEPGLIVLYSSELEEGIRKWCIVGEERWRTFGANIWYIVGEDYWYMVGANAWYIIAEDYWYIVVALTHFA